MSLLRYRMQRDMERAGLAPRTMEEYIRAVRDLAKFHRRSPDLLEPDDIRAWDEDLLRRKIKSSNHVLKYLGRYTHRVGIANSRLVNVTETAVTFRTRGDKTGTLLGPYCDV